MKNSGIRRWLALGALTLAVLALGLDMTVLNLALPTLATALHASTSELQWFVDAYSIVLAAIMLPAGLLGDRYGRKKVLLLALILFGIGSLACAYASSATMLIWARVVLGFGAAFIMPLSLAVIPVLFTDEERAKAVAVLMIGTMIAFPIGPILGGWLLIHFWWGSVFLMNVPVVILAMIAVTTLLPESRGAMRPTLDVVGIITSSLSLVGITYGVIEAGENGWTNPETISIFSAGILLAVVFIMIERHLKHPLIDLTLFKSPGFSWGTVLTTMVSFTMFGALFAVPQYYQEVGGADPLGSGLRLLPLIGGLLVGAPVANKLASGIGVKTAVAIGFLVLACGLSAGATTTLNSSVGFSATWLAVVGVGLGFAMPTVMDLALGELSAEYSGIGSALIQAVRQVGASIGVALLGSLLSTGYRNHLHISGMPAPVTDAIQKNVSVGVAIAQHLHSESLLHIVQSAFVYGMDFMLWVSGGLAVIGTLLAFIFLPRKRGIKVKPTLE